MESDIHNKTNSDTKKRYNILDEIFDLVNLRIIHVLEKNSLTPFIEISKIVGTSDSTVNLRVKKMQQNGLIKKFTISVDNNLLGYKILTYIGIKINSNITDQIVSDLETIEEILEIHEIYDNFDILIKIRTKNIDDLRELIVQKIRKIEGIRELKVMNVLRTKKEEQNVSIEKEINKRMKEFF